jgi:hypothetical protein
MFLLVLPSQFRLFHSASLTLISPTMLVGSRFTRRLRLETRQKRKLCESWTSFETEEERAHIRLNPAADNSIPLPLVISKLLELGADADLQTRNDRCFTPLDMVKRKMRDVREFSDTLRTPFCGHDVQLVQAKVVLLQAVRGRVVACRVLNS